MFDEDIPTSPLVSLLHRKQTTHINDKLKDANLSSGLYPILINVYKHENMSQEELASHLHINESTVTRNLDKLEKKGLITKTPEKRKKNLTKKEFEDFKKLIIKICEDLI